MANRRVVVTGIGLVSPLGIGTDVNWRALTTGQSGIGRITRFDASAFASQIAGEVKDFDPLQFVEKKDVKKMDVFIQYAIAAVAVRDGRLEAADHPGERAGRRRLHRARASAGSARIEREHEALLRGGPRRISPFFIPSAIINLAAGQVSIRFGAKGPNLATCTACSASAHAIGDSFEIIRRGDADAMIAGGSEAAITPMSVGGFAAMRALSTQQRRAREGLPAVRPGARRVHHRRRSRRRRARRARVGAEPRREDLRRESSDTACRATRITSPRRPKTAAALFA